MTSLTFNVNGAPGAQGSKRHVGHGRMIEQNKKVAPWRQDVRAAAEHAMQDPGTRWRSAWDGPVVVYATFRFPRPKSHYRSGRNSHVLRDTAPTWPTGKNLGDIDKLVRSSLDAIVAAGVIADDSLVAELASVTKRWCIAGEAPGATFTITTLTIEQAERTAS